MKKIISLAVIFCMLFTATASAFTVFKHTYTDVDGTVYHIGTFEEDDTDAGVIVNGKKYSLKSGIYMGEAANAWEEASGKQRRFALGLRIPAGSDMESYKVYPYSVDAEGNSRVGQSTIVYNNDLARYAIEKTIDAPVVADVVNAMDYRTAGSAAAGTLRNVYDVLQIKCDGNAAEVTTHNQVLLAKLDIRELKKNYLPGAEIKFTMKARYSGNWTAKDGNGNVIPNTLSSVKINVAGAGEAGQDWNEDNIPRFYKDEANKEEKSYYLQFGKKAPVDTLVLPVTDEALNSMQELTFNITGIVQEAIENGNDYASVAVWADNRASEAAKKENGGRNAYVFDVPTLENASYPYKLTYGAVDTNIELKTLKVNEEEVTKYIDGNNTYTKYLPFGTTEIPVVSAEAVSENAKVTVTQADSLNEKATVKITSADGSKTAEYIVQYVVSELPSQDTYKTLGWNSGVVANGNNNVISMDEQTSGNAILTYVDTPIRYQTGVKVTTNSDGTTKEEPTYKNFLATGKYLRLYNSPVAKAGYVPAISLMQLDLTKLINTHKLEIGSPIELHIDGEFKTYDTAADANVNSVELQLYDMTGTDWTDINSKINTIKGEAENIAKYDYKVNNTEVLATAESTTDALRTLLRYTTVLKNKKLIVSQNVPYGKYGLTTTSGSENNVYGNNRTFEENGFLKVDISEFVRYCVSTGNMTPTIGFYIAPCSSTVQNRQIGSIYYQGTGNMSYLKFGAEVELDEETLNSYKDASIHTLSINGTEVDVKYIDPKTNTYTAYLPAGTDLAPMVEATVNEKAKVEIEQAAMPDEDTVIKVTAYNGTVATYTVKSFVSEADSSETFTALGWNHGAIANGNKNALSVNAETQKTKTDGTKYGDVLYSYGLKNADWLSYSMAQIAGYNTPKATGGYKPNVALIQLDLSKLGNIDLSKPVVLKMDGSVSTYNSTNPATGVSISLYDASETDWASLNADMDIVRAYLETTYETDADKEAAYDNALAVSQRVKDYLRNPGAVIEGKTPIVTNFFAFGNYGLNTASASLAENNIYGNKYAAYESFAEFDISEFVRYCTATGNLTPTLAFYVNPSDADVVDRHLFSFYFSGSGNMSYIHYSK